MASPQLENGYLKIACELAEAFATYRIPGEQAQVLWVIIRKTYGFNKKSDNISNSQFCEATGLKKPSVCRAINCLIEKNIISKNANKNVPSYQLNKNYKTWKALAKKLTVSNIDNDVSKKANKALAKKLPTKEKKETLQKIFIKKLKPDFINDKDWDDLVAHRKKKKAAETERAVTLLIEQLKLAKDAGYTMKECIDEMVSRNWMGFKLEWMKNTREPAAPVKEKKLSKRCGTCHDFYREFGCFDKKPTDGSCDRHYYDPNAMGRMIEYQKGHTL